MRSSTGSSKVNQAEHSFSRFKPNKIRQILEKNEHSYLFWSFPVLIIPLQYV